MTLPIFPTTAFRVVGQRIVPVSRTLVGPRSLSGLQDVLELTGGGYWMLELEVKLLSTPELKAWRALLAQGRGGTTVFEVPFHELANAPVPINGGVPYFGEAHIPHSDGTMFDDSAGYNQPPEVIATTVGSAGLNATTFTVTTDGGPLIGGEHLGFMHSVMGPRAYRVAEILDQPSSSTFTVSTWPRLREAVAGGVSVNVITPSCAMRMVDPSAAEPTVDVLHRGVARIAFVEDFRL